METASISFDITIPENIAMEDLKAFVNFKLQIICQMDANIPLEDWDDLNPRFLSIRGRSF